MGFGSGVAGSAEAAGAASTKSLLSGGGGSSGIGTSSAGAGATGAIPSATGSVGAFGGISGAGAVGSDGGVAATFSAPGVVPTGSWIIFSSSFLMSVVSKVDFTAAVVSSNCFFRSAISASRIASWNWP